MSKFIFTGGLLLLLAGFLNYPTKPQYNTTASEIEDQMAYIVFPISKQIESARKDKRLSQKDLAEHVGMTRMTIERLEKGQLVPTKEMIAKLEKELNVSLSLMTE
jgi:ribosome-binding protein aMBF1 (putative translation factor)